LKPTLERREVMAFFANKKVTVSTSKKGIKITPKTKTPKKGKK
jgi:hypothetical protein